MQRHLLTVQHFQASSCPIPVIRAKIGEDDTLKQQQPGVRVDDVRDRVRLVGRRQTLAPQSRHVVLDDVDAGTGGMVPDRGLRPSRSQGSQLRLGSGQQRPCRVQRACTRSHRLHLRQAKTQDGRVGDAGRLYFFHRRRWPRRSTRARGGVGTPAVER